MTLRRRLARLEARAPDQLRARIAAMSDAELEAELARLEGVSIPESRELWNDPDARIAELHAQLDGMA